MKKTLSILLLSCLIACCLFGCGGSIGDPLQGKTFYTHEGREAVVFYETANGKKVCDWKGQIYQDEYSISGNTVRFGGHEWAISKKNGITRLNTPHGVNGDEFDYYDSEDGYEEYNE